MTIGPHPEIKRVRIQANFGESERHSIARVKCKRKHYVFVIRALG